MTACRRYTIAELLLYRGNASAVPNIDHIRNLISESNINASFRRTYSTLHSVRGQSYAAKRGNNIAQHRGKPRHALEITRMPLKDSRSALTLLLNKLGGDNAQQIAEQVNKVLVETEDLEQLISWFQDKTLPQTALAETFAGMWKCIFSTNATAKRQYLKACRARFEACKYNDHPADNEVILQLAHAVPALCRHGAISLIPVQALIQAYVKNITNSNACLAGLHVILLNNERKEEQEENDEDDVLFKWEKTLFEILKQLIAAREVAERNTLAEHLLTNLKVNTQDLAISFQVARALLLTDRRKEKEEGVLFTFSSTFTQKSKLNPCQASLFTSLISADLVPAELLRTPVTSIIETIHDCPDQIDTLLVLLTDCGGKRLPCALLTEAVEKARAIADNREKYCVSAKVRFKFMDLLDLSARGWTAKTKR